MSSTYTTNLGVEIIAPGEQTGGWGVTLNNNWNLVDEAVSGIVTVSLAGTPGTTGSPNILLIEEKTSSDGRNAHIEFTGNPGATAYVRLDPSDAEKLGWIKNSLTGGYALHIFQGDHDSLRELIIQDGRTVLVGFSGSGDTTAVATNILLNLQVDGLALANTNELAWTNAAGTNTVKIDVDANDDWTFTNNGTVSLKYDLSATSWNFQANGITTTGAVSGGSFGATGTVTGSNLSGINTGDELVAAEGQTGTVTLATQAEVDAGTDALKSITPATLANWSEAGTNSPMTTKGDVYVYSTTEDRLPIGANDYVLTADSAQATGMKWAAAAVAPTLYWNKSMSLENPLVNDELTIFFTEQALTITEIRAVLLGSATPSVQWSLYHGTNRTSGTLIHQKTTTSTTTGDDITSITDATIPANSFIWAEIDAQSGTVTEVNITMIGTVD